MFEIIKIYAGDTPFYISKDKLEKSDYFKNLIHFQRSQNSLSSPDETNLELKTDLEPGIFTYIVFHMKYNYITQNLSLDDLNKIKHMADFLLYKPLIENSVRPQFLDLVIEISLSDVLKVCDEEPFINISGDHMDYFIHCLEYKYTSFYINKVTDKIGNDFLAKTYGISKKIFNNNKLDRYTDDLLDRYVHILKIIKKIQHDLRMSIGKILMINLSSKIIVYVKYLDDNLLSAPCDLRFKRIRYDKFDYKDYLVVIKDLNANGGLPLVYYLDILV